MSLYIAYIAFTCTPHFADGPSHEDSDPDRAQAPRLTDSAARPMRRRHSFRDTVTLYKISGILLLTLLDAVPVFDFTIFLGL